MFLPVVAIIKFYHSTRLTLYYTIRVFDEIPSNTPPRELFYNLKRAE